MLNIPEEVKTLFKADSVFKNFHVHFPNSEYTDLNNDDIVSESVEFTESLCSQQAFRFGLTEASEIKFTCVNVPNIRGAVIECAIEIQADSLGAEWLEDNAPTGNEEFLDPQVCTYGGRNMYRVPYGRFIVDTCPRNHETMYKRDVTAYTERMDNAETLNPGQVAVMNAQYPDAQTYSPYVKALSIATMYNRSGDITGTGYVKGTLTNGGSMPGGVSQAIEVTLTGGSSVLLNAVVADRQFIVDTPSERDIFSIEWGEDADYVSEFADLITSKYDIDYGATGYASSYDLAEALLSSHQTDIARFYVQTGEWGGYAYIPYGTKLVYPHVKSGDTVYAVAVWYIVLFENYDHNVGNVAVNRVNFSVYHDASTDLASTMTVSFDSTLQTKKVDNGKVFDTYSFANAFSLSDIVQGYLELQCLFASPARTGGMEITALDNTSPVSILPENYAELWYDETTISPIGYVNVKFKGEDGSEQELTVQIGSGASVYDLRDNEVLNNMVFTVSEAEAEEGITIESKLLAFLNSVFTPNIPDLTFIPIELSKKGLPYLEAGDAVTITTGDGQIVPSFILRQTITGIQYLSADVESSNGEAMEMIET